MPALKLTNYSCEIVWLGQVSNSDNDLRAVPVSTLSLKFGGSEGECHSGLSRKSCSRLITQYPRGTVIANVRQLSIISQEELDQIALEVGLSKLDPALVGASMVVQGLPDFSHVPPSSRLMVESGASIIVDMENRPCSLPSQVIEKVHPGCGKAFKNAARNRRGVTAWVECEGLLCIGDKLRLHIPDQPIWRCFEDARAT